MAEGWAKHYLGESWQVESAGIQAHGVNKIAIEIMAEVGIDITDQKSEVIDPELLNQATLVITLCADAKDNCPLIPSHVKHEHWGFSDPAKASGTEEEIQEKFRQVRDEIGKKIRLFAANEKDDAQHTSF